MSTPTCKIFQVSSRWAMLGYLIVAFHPSFTLAQVTSWKWSLNPGDHLQLHLTQAIERLGITDDSQSSFELRVDLQWHVLDIHPESEQFHIRQTVQRVVWEQELPGLSLKFDSAEPNDPGSPAELRQALQRLIETPVEFYLSTSGRLSAQRDGADDAFDLDRLRQRFEPGRDSDAPADESLGGLLHSLQLLIPQLPVSADDGPADDSAEDGTWAYSVADPSGQIEHQIHCSVASPPVGEPEAAPGSLALSPKVRTISNRPEDAEDTAESSEDEQRDREDDDVAPWTIVAQRGNGEARFDPLRGIWSSSRLQLTLELQLEDGLLQRVGIVQQLKVERIDGEPESS